MISKQQEMEELKRLNAICFPKEDKENEVKVLNEKQIVKKHFERIHDWEYIQKAINLDNNLKNYIQNHKVLHKNTDPFINSAVQENILCNKGDLIHGNKNWEECREITDSIWKALKRLAITQAQEEEVDEIMKQFNKLSLTKDSIKNEYNTIMKTLEGIIEKIELIASKPFKDCKLKDIHYVCNVTTKAIIRSIINLITPFVDTGITQWRTKAGYILLNNSIQKHNENVRRRKYTIWKNSIQYIKQGKRRMKLKYIIMIKLMKMKVIRARALVQSLNKWKLALNYIEHEALKLLSQFCKDIFNQAITKNPWNKLNTLIHNFLSEQTKIAYADYVLYNKPMFTIFKPESNLQLHITSGGITAAALYNTIEVHNIHEHPKLNLVMDIPIQSKVMGLLCMPVIRNGEVLGVLRMYKENREKFSRNAIRWGNEVEKCLAAILPKVDETVKMIESTKELVLEEKVKEENARNELKYKQITHEAIKEIISINNKDQCLCTIEKILKNTIQATNTSIAVYDSEKSYFTNIKGDVKKSKVLLEALKAKEIVEVREEDKEVLYIPIEANSCRGLLCAERDSLSDRWLDRFDQHTWNFLNDILPIFLVHIQKLHYAEAVNSSYNEQLIKCKRFTSIENLVFALDKLRLNHLFCGWNTIVKEESFKYKNLKSLFIFPIITIIKTNIGINFRTLKTAIRDENKFINSLKVLNKIVKAKCNINIRNAWIRYRETVALINHKKSINNISDRYRYTAKNISYSLDYKADCDVKIALMKQKVIIRRVCAILNKKYLHNIGRLVLQKLNILHNVKVQRETLLKKVLKIYNNKLRRQGFRKYNNIIKKLFIIKEKYKKGMNIIAKVILLHENFKLSAVFDHWRKSLIEKLKTIQKEHKEKAKQLNTIEEQQDFVNTIYSMLNLIIDTTYNSLEELFQSKEYGELVTCVTQYFSVRFTAYTCLFTVYAPCDDVYYLCGAKSDASKPIFTFLLPSNDAITNALKETLKPLRFTTLECNDPITTSIKQRRLKFIKAGLILPLINSNNIIGTLELYRKVPKHFAPIEEEQCIELMSLIFNKLCTTINSLIFSIERREDIKFIKEQYKLLIKSFISSNENNGSLNTMLENMKTIGEQLLEANKILIMITDTNLQLCSFYNNGRVYNFNFAGTFIESVVNSGESITFPIDENKKVQAISEEEYEFIKYLPIKYKGKVMCICEICYSLQERYSGNEMIEEVYVEALRNGLIHFKNVFGHFLRVLSNAIKIKDRRNFEYSFFMWRSKVKLINYDEEVKLENEEHEKVELKLTEIIQLNQDYSEKIEEQKNMIENVNIEIQNCTEKITELRAEQNELELEKSAKLKFLASALLFNQIEAYSFKASKMQSAWQRWANHLFCEKAIETTEREAENLIEMHKKVEYKAGIRILIKTFKKKRYILKEEAFKRILIKYYY